MITERELSKKKRLTGSKINFSVKDRIGSKNISRIISNASVRNDIRNNLKNLLTGGIVNL
jgi:hypothetical protein